MLTNCRTYLAAARHLEYVLPEAMSSQVQDDLVRYRQSNRAFGAEDMHRLLTLARLLTVSYGESELSAERWAELMAMESERCARVAAPVTDA